MQREQYEQIAEHVAVCPHCQTELHEFATPLKEEVSDDSAWARAGQMLTQVGLIVAQLVTPMDNLRPVLRGETREVLLFEAGETAVSLNVEPTENGRFTLHGQVLAPQILTGRARLTAVNQLAQESALLSTGTFTLVGILPDHYQLSITLPEQQIILPALSIEV